MAWGDWFSKKDIFAPGSTAFLHSLGDTTGRETLEKAKGDFGLPGADARGNYLSRNARDNERQANTFLNSDFRGNQQSLIGRLEEQASGRNSVAEQMYRQAADRNMRQQAALAGSARPGQGGLAALQAAQNNANTGMQLGGAAALARIQEQQQANALLGGVLQGARGQDIGVGQSRLNAQLAFMDQDRMNAMGQQQGMMAFHGAMAGLPTQPAQIASAGASGLAAFATGGGAPAGGGSFSPAQRGTILGNGRVY